jgi:hypothetical protein
LGVALILKTGLSVADYQALKAEDLQLRQAIQDSYRRVNPRGAVVDVEKQLNRQLAELGAGAQRRAFTPVLVTLLSAAGAVPDITLTSVNFSGGREIRINLSAPNFQSVEQVREQLGQRSLQASLENSNARGDGVVARLRVADLIMRQWFESLPSRDQIALMALVAAVGLWLFIQLIFIDLDGRRARLTQGKQALTEKLMPRRPQGRATRGVARGRGRSENQFDTRTQSSQ